MPQSLTNFFLLPGAVTQLVKAAKVENRKYRCLFDGVSHHTFVRCPSDGWTNEPKSRAACVHRRMVSKTKQRRIGCNARNRKCANCAIFARVDKRTDGRSNPLSVATSASCCEYLRTRAHPSGTFFLYSHSPNP